jgi:hypothetical protein
MRSLLFITRIFSQFVNSRLLDALIGLVYDPLHVILSIHVLLLLIFLFLHFLHFLKCSLT